MNAVNSRDKRTFSSERSCFLWFAMMLLYPMVGVPVIIISGEKFGAAMPLAVGLIIFAGYFLYLRGLYRWLDRINAQRRTEIRQTYRGIYRVKGPPSSHWSWLKENIKVGDYGWERPPWGREDLIFLHGIQEQWGVVWIAGFRPEDVEYITTKPVSEYDWTDFEYDGPKPSGYYSWGISKAKLPCPFPVNTNNRKVFKWRFPV